VIVLGDESGYVTGQVQKVKLAAMEAHWETDPAPSALTLIGWPNQETRETEAAIKVPWLGGLIITRSIDTPVPGIKQLVAENEERIRSGMVAYGLLEQLRQGERSPEVKAAFRERQDDLGYGLLLQRYTPRVTDATETQIKQAAWDTIPRVAPMFWSFRIMVGLGFWMLALIAVAFYYTCTRVFDQKRWLLKLLIISAPAPWIAAELGWFVAEFGRQPWSIGDILPTYLAVSSLTRGDLIGSIAALVLLYTVLLTAEVYLMQKFIRRGPSSLHTGRYHFEHELAV
jgi:cytochrome d ubiquinol oxidase subunit I